MDAANLQKVHDGDAFEDASASAGPIEDFHERIATAFAGDQADGDVVPAAASAGPLAGDVTNRFSHAAEGQIEAISQLRQLDREELDTLRQALRDLCDGTAHFLSHTEQHFADMQSIIAVSDGKLAALAADHALHNDRLDAADRILEGSENKLATLAADHAVHNGRLDATDRLLEGCASGLERLAADHAVHNERLDAADRTLEGTESRLASLAADHAMHNDRLDAADRILKESESRLTALAADHGAHNDRLEATDKILKDSGIKLAILAANHAAHAEGLEAVHQRLRDTDAVLQKFGKLLEAANDRSSQLDSSIAALLDHNKGITARQNVIEASVGRLEQLISSLDRRLDAVSALAEPMDVLREQNIEMANHQRELGKIVELVFERTKTTGESEAQFTQRINAVEEKIAASTERLESISRWQLRVGLALLAEPHS
jgi:chromosome segregation ATPase